MAFTPKSWKNSPDTSTPISAAALMDLEARVAAYVDALAPPIGVPIPFPGATAPTGYIFYQGGTISRGGNPVLFGIFGTAFGAGDGSTTFGLPDLRGRTLVAAGGANGASLQALGGANVVALAVSDLPSHSHRADGAGGAGGATTATSTDHYHSGVTLNDGPDHTHDSAVVANFWVNGDYGQGHLQGGAGTAWTIYALNSVTSGGASVRHQHSYSTPYQSFMHTNVDGASSDPNHAHGINAQGGGGSHNNMPPYFAVNWMTRLG